MPSYAKGEIIASRENYLGLGPLLRARMAVNPSQGVLGKMRSSKSHKWEKLDGAEVVETTPFDPISSGESCIGAGAGGLGCFAWGHDDHQPKTASPSEGLERQLCRTLGPWPKHQNTAYLDVGPHGVPV